MTREAEKEREKTRQMKTGGESSDSGRRKSEYKSPEEKLLLSEG